MRTAGLLALLLTMAAAPAPPAPILAAGAPRDAPGRLADRQLVLGFIAGMASPGGAQQAADDYLAADLRNHNPSRPSGAQNYANYFLHPAPYGNREPPPAGAAPAGLLVADGQLTLVTHAADRDGGFDADLYETRGGRITQIWNSGPADQAAPAIAAQDPPTTAPSPADAPARQANLALVRGFIAAFLGRGDVAAASVLAPGIVSHMATVPSGDGFAAVAHKHEDRLAPDDVSQILFALADGDLVAIGFALPFAGDPGARFATVVARVRDGRIAEWWYSGLPAGHPVIWRKPTPSQKSPDRKAPGETSPGRNAPAPG